jgi:hypothetical protein
MTIYRKFIPALFLFLLTIAASSAVSQTITAMAKLDTNAMLIGDQVKLDMRFSFPKTTLVRWPLIGDTILKGIQVIERSKVDTTISPDKKTVTLHQTLLLTSFDSGFYAIPSLRFFYRQPPDTTIHFAQSDILLLSVHTMAVDTTKAIKPIKDPMKVPLTFREVLPYLLLGILLVLIITAVVYYLKKRKKAEPFFQLRPVVQLPPQEIALAELERLRIKKLWQEGRIKEYHSELTDIIRKYLEGRFTIMAMEMTSMEILHSLKDSNSVSNEPMEKLNYILTLADLVKFAKMLPLPTENDMSMSNAVGFVQETAVKKDQSIQNDERD